MSLFNNKLQKVQMGMLAQDVQDKFASTETQLAQIATNIKSLGAVGDGGTNNTNTTILQNAINNNSVILIPDGIFMVDSITITKAVKIIGTGTLKLKSGNTNSILLINADNCVIEDITLDGNNNTFNYGQGCLYVYSGIKNTKIQNCICNNGDIVVCGDKSLVFANILNNCSIKAINSKHNTIENNLITPSSGTDGISVYCDGSNQYISLHNKIIKNRILGCTRIGIEVFGYSQYTIVSNNFIQMVDSANTYFAISISRSPNSIVLDNYMECNSNVNIAAIEITYSSDNTICERNAITNFKRGFQFSQSSNNIEIVENIISKIYETGIWGTGGTFNNLNIERNKIYLNTDDSTIEQRGMNLGITGSNIRVINNVLSLISNLATPRNLFGISLINTISYCLIKNNIFTMQCVAQSVFQCGIYSPLGTNVIIEGNEFTDVNGSKCSAITQYGSTLSDTLKIVKNLFSSLYRAIHCEGNTNDFIFLQDNDYQNVANTDWLKANFVINRYRNQGNYYKQILKEVNSSNPPSGVSTTAVWQVGDRATNTTLAVGQPKGWICTTAGTGASSVWTSEGNL